MKFTPRSTARCNAGMDVASSVGPYEFPCAFPPTAHAPNPISDTFKPVRPRRRVFISRSERNGFLEPLRGRRGWACDDESSDILGLATVVLVEIGIDNCKERFKRSHGSA